MDVRAVVFCQNAASDTLTLPCLVFVSSLSKLAVIIFDWDDTICPSSFVDQFKVDNFSELPLHVSTSRHFAGLVRLHCFLSLKSCRLRSDFFKRGFCGTFLRGASLQRLQFKNCAEQPTGTLEANRIEVEENEMTTIFHLAYTISQSTHLPRSSASSSIFMLFFHATHLVSVHHFCPTHPPNQRNKISVPKSLQRNWSMCRTVPGRCRQAWRGDHYYQLR